MKKMYFVMALLIVVSMVLTACGASAPSEADCSKAEVFCVGLVTDVGKVNDREFLNQSALGRRSEVPGRWRGRCNSIH